MDPVLLWILVAATIIYIVLMIEAVTRKPDEKPGSQFGKEKKEMEPEKEKEKRWPPKEDSD